MGDSQLPWRIEAQPEEPSLGNMVQAANDVAKTARALLAAVLAVALTLAATMIAATDEALFRDAAKVLPSLGVEIRLSTAFSIAPHPLVPPGIGGSGDRVGRSHKLDTDGAAGAEGAGRRPAVAKSP
jgi:hypothetical protein